MRTTYLISIVLAVCLAAPWPAAGVTWDVRFLTDNEYGDYEADIGGSRIVWAGYDGNDYEIFLYDINDRATTQLTDNDYDDRQPRVTSTHVAWKAKPTPQGGQIYVYDGVSAAVVSNVYDVSTQPRISGSLVTWQGRYGPTTGNDYEIFSYDGTTTTQLTSNDWDDVDPQVSGPNIVWRGNDGNDDEIFLRNHDTATTTQLTSNTLDDRDAKVSGHNVVWTQSSGYPDVAIMLYDGSSTTQLTASGERNHVPDVSGSNVVWLYSVPGQPSIVTLYDGETATQLTDGTLTVYAPYVSGSYVTWGGIDGDGDTEVYVYDGIEGTTGTAYMPNWAPESDPSVSGPTVVWHYNDGDSEIYMRTKQLAQDDFLDYGEDVRAQIGSGSGEIGGIDFLFDEVTLEGELTADYREVPADELGPEYFDVANFFLPTDPVMMWDLAFEGEFAGEVEMTFGYDDSNFMGIFTEETITVYHKLPDLTLEPLPVVARDLDANTITVLTTGFSEFVIGSPVPEPATLFVMGCGAIGLLRRHRRA